MRKRNKGFTLIEVVVTIAIVGILSAGFVSILPTLYNSTNNSNYLSEAQTVAKMIKDNLEGELRYADAIDIKSSLPSPLVQDYEYIYISSGKIYKNSLGGTAQSISPAPGFNEYSYSISFAPENAKVLKVDLVIYINSKQVYSVSSKIFISNLGAKSITGVNPGNCISYQQTMQQVTNAPAPTSTPVKTNTPAPSSTPVPTPSPSPVPTPTPSPAPILVTSIVVSSSSSTITTDDQTMQMSATVSPSNAANKGVAWSVNDTSLASIDQFGLLTPLKNGNVIVTATAVDGSLVKGSKTITLSNQIKRITSFTLSTSTHGTTLSKGGYTMTIIPTITPSDATNQTLTWSVDNINYATISSSGVLTSKSTKNVSVIVSAKTTDGSNITMTIEIQIT